MRLSFGQEMRMVQKQILAPRMIQSMEILQLPILALQERIEQEIQENPVLDLREDDPDLPQEEVERESPDAPTDEERVLVIDEGKDNEADFERLMNLDGPWPEHFEENSRPSRSQIEEEGDRKLDAMANMEARAPTLQDYLHDQLGYYDLDEPVRAMADRIIFNLDSNGYLQGCLEDLLGADATPSDLDLARQALAVVQRLDPPGVGARDLRECLLLQVLPGTLHFQSLRILIANHLEDLENNRIPQIAKQLGCTIDQVHELTTELRKLDPKPGARFGEKFVPSVVPDIFVEQADSGQYAVRLEDSQTPNLFISPYYRKLLADTTANEETREYIKRKINAAQWLIEAIEQRRATLTKVAQAIVDHQREFLSRGPEAIEPLKMQQIADKVGVHVTTVSRAVDDKWIQTPRGIFPLRRFFCGGTVTEDGGEVAWDAVRLKLQEIIDAENRQSPHSDDDLVNELAKHGIKVARRTVTKYRKAMKIPSSRQRREWRKGDEA